MKVAIVTSFPQDPGLPHGGVESVSVNLVRALSKLDDLELHVVTTDPDCNGATRSLWENVTIHRLPRLGRRVLTDAIGPGRRQVKEYLTALAPDIIHAHDTYGLMVKGLPVPRVFTIHGFIHGDLLVSDERFARLRSQVWKWLETAGWADQPHIISISPYVRERLSGVARGVIHDIDNPLDESFFSIKRGEQKGTIFSAAMIMPRKNTVGLIAAFARLIANGFNAELRLAGSASDARYERRVREFISSNGLRDRVVLLGGIDTARIQQELAKASVFALVSLEENSPMGIEEAMASGVPVVTSNRCGMPYMVRDGESGFLVNPNDSDDIAWRLGQLLEDDALRAAMGVKSRNIAEERFHPARVARRTREVYRRALRTGRPDDPSRAQGSPLAFQKTQLSAGNTDANADQDKQRHSAGLLQ